MKKILMGLAALAGLSASTAMAADLSAPVYTKAPPPPAIYNWTGFYIGGQGGMGEGHTKEQFALATTQSNQGISGGMAGVTAGYNWQFGATVVGVEADWDWTDIKGSAACPNALFTCFSKLDDVATFRGRFGWAANGPVLLYVTGGAAYANAHNGALNAAGNPGTGATGVFNSDRWGWAAGAGLEYGFLPNWSAKVEYMHYGFLNYTAPSGSLSGTSSATLSHDIDTIKFGVNYHFNWGTPVVAKY